MEQVYDAAGVARLGGDQDRGRVDHFVRGGDNVAEEVHERMSRVDGTDGPVDQIRGPVDAVSRTVDEVDEQGDVLVERRAQATAFSAFCGKTATATRMKAASTADAV